MCLKVAGTAIMAGGIHSVGSQLHLQTVIALDSEIFGSRSTGLHIPLKHHDPLMALAEPDLILGTYHAE